MLFNSYFKSKLNMTLIIVITVCLLFLVLLLLVPITLYIDTASNQYYLKLEGLIKADLEKDETEFLRIRLKVLFTKFYIYPLKKMWTKKREKQIKKANKNRSFIKLFKILKTCKVKLFYINIDTGNCILNAKLYPLFALLNYNHINCHINFQERNQLVLLVKNRPIDILKSFINL